ncbi:ATP-binding protein [Pseudonocardia parietis]|uniref:Anti-sigma regulatory factor (Ser/Thr protein kinase) n=1 Tax=Pseudonocardia parietis TaxID=570936 RepID=A0ABS4W8J0_9PSEU|nr:ATP-binding protein [Pseudonocardia parietis]MBP2371949.1 anti-sigma regulatory factor (Ser/Thr protein kinase) [Pseudonocardia parietis]
MTVSVDPGSIPVARGHFRDWLKFLAWPDTSGDDLLLAVGEAVTNAIEHAGAAPRGANDDEQTVQITAEVTVTTEGRRIRIQVRDRGRWREPDADPQWARYRGMGIPLMRELVEQMAIVPADPGTEVTLVSRMVPAVD